MQRYMRVARQLLSNAYPSKQIQLVVTTAAGGATDLVARTLAQRLSDAMRQPVVVENQPAGSGAIAAAKLPAQVQTAIRCCWPQTIP